MKLFGSRIAYFFAVVLLVLVCFLDFELGSSFNVEGRRVLGFREEPEVDPHGLVSNRRVEVEEDHDRRSPVRVLSIDGRVVSLKYGNRNIRERLHTNIREQEIFWSGNNRKVRALKSNNQNNDESSQSPSPSKTPFPKSSTGSFQDLAPHPSNGVKPAPAPAPSTSLSPSPNPFKPPEAHPRHHIQTATSNKQTLPIVIGVVMGAVLMVLAVILAVFCRNKKVVDIKPQKKEGLSEQLRKALVTGVPSLNHSELESACEDFSNEIGSLSDGKLKYGNRNIRERLHTNIREQEIFWSGNNRKVRALKSNNQNNDESSQSPSPSKTPFPKSSTGSFQDLAPHPSNGVKPAPAPAPSTSLSPSPNPFKPPEAHPRHHIQTATSNKQTLPIVIGVVMGAVLMVLAVILAVFCRNKKVVDIKPQKKEGLSEQLRKALVTGVPSLNHSELESACEDFSNEIGSLSDGKLYKGTLAAGAEIAVNVIELGRNWASHHEDQFKKKISTMSKVNHKNFVNLIGYCEEEEPLSRMMVFEYASNGTLFEHLHPKEEDSNSLTWPQRSRIAMGAAYCLAHMHLLDPPVILQNLDSSSIFLTDDYAAKIADMELQSQTTCIKTNPRNPGILLEEQMQKQQSLVHKYGTLLLELISGRPPNSDESGGLVNWALDHLKGTKPLEEILDPTLTSFPADKLRSICHVIESCLNPDLKRRPSMQDVTAQLREITGVTPDAAAPRLSPSWWTELEMVSLAVHPKTE